MDLLQLRYFYDSANYMSISKTAKKYRVPSTSVSASIRRLEEDLGCKLFDRLPNRIVLNDKGKCVKDSLRKVFDEIDNMLQVLSGTTDDKKEIKILVRSIRSLITEQMIKYKNEYPSTRFQLVSEFNETNIDEYDVIIDTQCELYTGFESLNLGKQKILLYAAVDNALQGRKLSLKQLSKESFVIMSRQGNLGKLLISSCERLGFFPNIVAQVNDLSCFRKIISSGIAIGISGEFLENNPSVTALDITDFHHTQNVCLYYKNDNFYGSTAKFISFVLNNLKDMPIL